MDQQKGSQAGHSYGGNVRQGIEREHIQTDNKQTLLDYSSIENRDAEVSSKRELLFGYAVANKYTVKSVETQHLDWYCRVS